MNKPRSSSKIRKRGDFKQILEENDKVLMLYVCNEFIEQYAGHKDSIRVLDPILQSTDCENKVSR